MLKLSQEIKASGISPWTYQGIYPQYMLYLLDSLVFKHGGLEATRAIDNLQPGAWTAPAVKDAVDALYQLAAMDYIMPGTAGLTHTRHRPSGCGARPPSSRVARGWKTR